MNLTAGTYPIAIAYFLGSTANGAGAISASWQTPGSGSFVTIPSSAFVDANVVNGAAPTAASNLVATTLSYNSVGLAWADTSANETGFEVWRSTNATTGFAIVNTTGAGVMAYTDATAAPNTLYYYEVRAINQYGQSPFTAASSTTTLPLPLTASTPYNLAVQSTSMSSLNVSWTDSSAVVTNFQLYRSETNDQNYVLIATLPGTTTSYTDGGLYANAVYYYKLTASNAGGVSAYATEVSGRTQDVHPVITKLGNQTAQYGVTTTVGLSATSVYPGTLSFTGHNLPTTFASLTDNGNNTATLTFSPTIANQGNYPGLYVVVADAFGGTDTTTFNLAVNNFVAPTINPISNVTMNEGDTLSIPLVATDQNTSDTLSFAVTGQPGGSSLTQVSNGVATLFLHPGFAAAGTYSVTATANDHNGTSATKTFTVTVKYKNPNTKIFTRVSNNDAGALGLPWNALQGTTTTGLLDSAGNATGLGLSFSPSTWWNTSIDGSSTGNNSGVYPDVVLLDYMWFGAYYGGPNSITGTVTGADTSQTYSLTFFSNSTYNGIANNGTTTYTVGSQTVSLAVQNNQHNTATIGGIKANPDGTIPFSLGLGANTVLGYINAIVITKQFDDGSVPAGVSGLTGQAVTGKVNLSWTDSAYNATGYQVWRAPGGTTNFSLLGTVAGNSANSYVDSAIIGHTPYAYTVRAYNVHGFSGYSDTATLTTLNRLPKITAIANINLVDTTTLTVNVTTSDDSTAQLTLTAANLPPFVTFTDNGNGTGVLKIAPTAGTVGVYPNLSVTVADQFDSTATTSFVLAVTEPNVQSVYVNFTGGPTSPLPWNSLLTPPFAGTVMSNLVDASNSPTTISATIVDGFYWYGFTGWVTGNNDGLYPQPVIQNFLYDPSTATRRIQISGLDNSKQYNFVFFNSQWDGTNGMTYFSINGQTDSLQADWNINKTVQLNAIRPVNGVVTIGVTKGPIALNSYINSIVIQGYDTTAGLLLNPTSLITTGYTQTTVNLEWQDRSAIETGYEVWRATDASGAYSLLASLPANTVTYKDTKLNLGTNYYYIVRAVSNGNYSNYSNVLAVTTYSDAVYIAVNNTPAASFPWNNLSSPGRIGQTWKNFLDSTGVVTSMGLTQTGLFAGANSLGDVTGNNSGVYPDAVMKYQYVLFAGNFGGFTLTGLNVNKTYDITFMGSENYEAGNNNTAYIVGSDTVWLNALDNQHATVTMRGLQPDQNGNIAMTFISYGASIAGWLNSMVVDGYTAIPKNAPVPPQVAGGANTTIDQANPSVMAAQVQTMNIDTVVSAYPNPFHQFFTLSVPADYNNEKVVIGIYDAKGNLVYRKEFDNLVQGENYLPINADRNFAGTGVYVARLAYSDGKTIKTFKLLRQ
jgi:fibronectin type 3 domain-containing protein